MTYLNTRAGLLVMFVLCFSPLLPAQAPAQSRSLAEVVIQASAAHGQRLTAPDSEVLVDEASFTAALPLADVATAIDRAGGHFRASSRALVVCGETPHSCRHSTGRLGIRLVELQQHGDSAQADVVVSVTVPGPGTKSDVAFKMLRLRLQRTKGEWQVVTKTEMFTT